MATFEITALYTTLYSAPHMGGGRRPRTAATGVDPLRIACGGGAPGGGLRPLPVDALRRADAGGVLGGGRRCGRSLGPGLPTDDAALDGRCTRRTRRLERALRRRVTVITDAVLTSLRALCGTTGAGAGAGSGVGSRVASSAGSGACLDAAHGCLAGVARVLRWLLAREGCVGARLRIHCAPSPNAASSSSSSSSSSSMMSMSTSTPAASSSSSHNTAAGVAAASLPPPADRGWALSGRSIAQLTDRAELGRAARVEGDASALRMLAADRVDDADTGRASCSVRLPGRPPGRRLLPAEALLGRNSRRRTPALADAGRLLGVGRAAPAVDAAVDRDAAADVTAATDAVRYIVADDGRALLALAARAACR